MRFQVLSLLALSVIAACSAPVEPAAEAEQSAAPAPAAAPVFEGESGKVYHIGNAGLLIQKGATKILFDPLYCNGYNNYHLVPEATKRDVLAGVAPFDDISAILILSLIHI